MIRPIFDTLLDRSILGGYSNLGYRARRSGFAALGRLDGRRVVMTGATSGIGTAAAQGFARLGAELVLLVRDERRGHALCERLVETAGHGNIHVERCELSSLTSVRECADRLQADSSGLDVLVNNAGVLRDTRTLSPDGNELTFATNVLGPFLLTNLLTPSLAARAPARVINVSSGGMYSQRIQPDDLQSERDRFDGVVAYARAKRAQVILTELWAQRLQGQGIAAHAMHPGWVDTPGVESSLPGFHRLMRPLLRTPDQGADTILWLATAPERELGSGRFWHDRRARPSHLLPRTRESAADRVRLWTECAALSGWAPSRLSDVSSARLGA
ncbi:MAG: SDR family NAD(P)-dependent oxidoreductase [Solirubrobacteraceae bacterium]